jgi:hypothetical protein
MRLVETYPIRLASLYRPPLPVLCWKLEVMPPNFMDFVGLLAELSLAINRVLGLTDEDS